MHPGSSTPSGKVERHSLTDGGLYGLYNAAKELAVAKGDHSRNFNAKNAGTEPAAAADAIIGGAEGASSDIAQKNFKIKQPLKITQFTAAGLNYATNVLKLDTTKYGSVVKR